MEFGFLKPYLSFSINLYLRSSAQEIDCLLFDTAGRINIDQTLMNELNQLEKEINPTETLLVLDSLTGQEAVNVATDFSKTITVTGTILTRVDGDARGGAALSMKYATNCPIKFMGMGEQMDAAVWSGAGGDDADRRPAASELTADRGAAGGRQARAI